MASVRSAERDGRTWIRLEGQLDHEGCAEISAAFDRSLRGARSEIIIDLRDVTFIASQGIRMLLQGYKSAQPAGFAMKVTGLSPLTRRVFDTTGLFQAIPEL